MSPATIILGVGNPDYVTMRVELARVCRFLITYYTFPMLPVPVPLAPSALLQPAMLKVLIISSLWLPVLVFPPTAGLNYPSQTQQLHASLYIRTALFRSTTRSSNRRVRG